MVFKTIIKPILFGQDPEKIHESVSSILSSVGKSRTARAVFRNLFEYKHPLLETKVAGMNFNNPTGLAAGFDKHCRLISIIPCLGFGHIEVGTITGQAQQGNDKPRLFRLPKDKALINRMGFNNQGADAIKTQFEKNEEIGQAGKRSCPVGINIGKSKVIPLEKAVDDYLYSFEQLHSFADYI